MEEIAQMVERHFIVEVMGSRPILFFHFYFWRLNIMEDIMLIRSSFLRRIISQVINKILKKQLPGTEVQLGEVQANWSEKEQKLKIHLVVDAEMTKAQLMDILKKADVI
jgi:uncharacterized protein (UPF0254 family)